MMIYNEITVAHIHDEKSKRLYFSFESIFNKKILFRLTEQINKVLFSFWINDGTNNVYQALFILVDAITSLKPAEVFKLPKLIEVLSDCARNISKYEGWASGKLF